MEVQRTRKIRISFSDPDATDSDSGEDTSSTSRGKTNIVVILHHCSSISSSTSAAKTNKNPGGCGGGSQQRQAILSSSAASCGLERATVGSASAPVTMKRCRGVYERQPGRWAAEFRSQRLRARHWIGTFATEAEARAAYDDFERQFFVPSRRCGLPPAAAALERPGRAAAVHRASHPHRQRRPHPPPHETEKRQIIVQALPAPGITLPRLPSSAPAASAPCVSKSASVPPPPPPPVVPMTFENTLPSVHSFWADEPADEDFVGLADLRHLPLPFSDGSMDFDLADLSSLLDDFL